MTMKELAGMTDVELVAFSEQMNKYVESGQGRALDFMTLHKIELDVGIAMMVRLMKLAAEVGLTTAPKDGMFS